MLKRLRKFFHLHDYTIFIASQYRTFNYRNIVKECSCGKRRLYEDYHHDLVYPFQTTLGITTQDMKELANTNKTVKEVRGY